MDKEDIEPMHLDSDLLFFLWQIFHRRKTSVLDEHILKEQWINSVSWVCSWFDEWKRCFNKTEIYKKLFENAILFWLIDELIISVRTIWQKEKHPAIVEVKRLHIDKKFIQNFYAFAPHRIDGENLNQFQEFELFWDWFYSPPFNNYTVYFSYKPDYEQINRYIEDYICDWKNELLKNPFNYILPRIQIEKFIDIMLTYSQAYGQVFKYELWTNPKLDEPTLIIYFQALDWIRVIHFDINEVQLLLGEYKSPSFLIEVTNWIHEYKQMRMSQSLNNIIPKKLIIEVWANYFESFKGWPYKISKWNSVNALKEFEKSKWNNIALRNHVKCKNVEAFRKFIRRLNEDIKPWWIAVSQVWDTHFYEITRVEDE